MSRDVSIRELHEKTGQLVDQAAEGAIIVIKRRGQPVAELRCYAPKTKPMPDFDKRYAKYPQVDTDSSRFLEQDRR